MDTPKVEDLKKFDSLSIEQRTKIYQQLPFKLAAHLFAAKGSREEIKMLFDDFYLKMKDPDLKEEYSYKASILCKALKKKRKRNLIPEKFWNFH